MSESQANSVTRSEVVANTRCGLCRTVVEVRHRDGKVFVSRPYALCMSCDAVRCEECWGDPDDPCEDADDHEFMKVRVDSGGTPRTVNFTAYIREQASAQERQRSGPTESPPT